MFGERETLKEAYDYVTKLAQGSDDAVAMLTAVHVMMNTIAKQVEALDGQIY
jgi:hypothetical protein